MWFGARNGVNFIVLLPFAKLFVLQFTLKSSSNSCYEFRVFGQFVHLLRLCLPNLLAAPSVAVNCVLQLGETLTMHSPLLRGIRDLENARERRSIFHPQAPPLRTKILHLLPPKSSNKPWKGFAYRRSAFNMKNSSLRQLLSLEFIAFITFQNQ